jgi:hypothetical protein
MLFCFPVEKGLAAFERFSKWGKFHTARIPFFQPLINIEYTAVADKINT